QTQRIHALAEREALNRQLTHWQESLEQERQTWQQRQEQAQAQVRVLVAQGAWYQQQLTEQAHALVEARQALQTMTTHQQELQRWANLGQAVTNRWQSRSIG
ncbi:MAG: hypothetical protein ACUVSQ_10555, partial [Pseudanabaenaceae cyanobacterium]